jgi:predicted ATPase
MLNKLKLINFKCFKDGEFNFKPLTFLAGGNGVGKSSVIQSLLYLNAIYNDGGQHSVDSQISDIDFGSPNKIISADADTTDKNIEINPTIDGVIYPFKLTLSGDFISEYKFFVDIPKKYDDFRKKYILSYISAERLAPQSLHDAKTIRNNYVGMRGENAVEALSQFEKQSTINSAIANLDNLTKEIKLDYVGKSFLVLVNKWLDYIIGGTEIQTSDIADISKKTIKIKNQGEFYVPTATGFGISYVLPIIVQGLISALTKQILVIENPEVHLHPKSQSRIGQFLAQVALNTVQVIVETHSEHVINGARIIMGTPDNFENMATIFFAKESTNVTANEIVINKFGEMLTWPKGFFDQKEIDLLEILSRKVKR